MPLDIYLSETADVAAATASDLRLSLEDDGVLRCIQQFAGPSIDPYGSAVVDLASLTELQAALGRARAHFQSGPEQLNVWLGTEVKPQHRELYESVSRVRVLAAIVALEALLAEALATGQFLVLSGD